MQGGVEHDGNCSRNDCGRVERCDPDNLGEKHAKVEVPPGDKLRAVWEV